MTTKNLSKATCKELQNHFTQNNEFPETVTVGKKIYDFVEFMEDKGFYTATYELGDKLVQGSFTIKNQTLKNTTMKNLSVKKEMLDNYKLFTKDVKDISKEQLVAVLKKIKNDTELHTKVIEAGGALVDFVNEFNLVFASQLDSVKATIQETAKVEKKKVTIKKEVVDVKSSPKKEEELTELEKMRVVAIGVNDESSFKKLNNKIKKAGMTLISRRTGDVITFKGSQPSKRNPDILAGEFETAEGKSIFAQFVKFGRFISVAEVSE